MSADKDGSDSGSEMEDGSWAGGSTTRFASMGEMPGSVSTWRHPGIENEGADLRLIWDVRTEGASNGVGLLGSVTGGGDNVALGARAGYHMEWVKSFPVVPQQLAPRWA